MHSPESKSPTSSIRTDYSQKRGRRKINRVNSQNSNCKTNYNLSPNNFNTNIINYYNKKEKIRKPYYINSPWSNILSKTSNEGKNQIPNPKSYKSNNILANEHFHNYDEKRYFKESSNYDYTTKTQITTLPGGVKRNKYEIKDDMYFRKPYNESRLYKMVHDFNCNIDYDKNYDPITQGYNVNCFPTKQRFFGSYKRGMKDHDIFNTNYNSNYYIGFNDCCFSRK